MTTKATASARNDGGLPAPERRQKPRPAGRKPYGRGAPTPGRPPRFPGPVVARRCAVTGTGIARSAAVEEERRAVCVQQWTARGGRQGARADIGAAAGTPGS